MGLVDLHLHSSYSYDGDTTPQELIETAIDKNLAAIAITDHNTTAGVEEFLEIAADKDIEAIPGIEIDTSYGDNELHMLGYYLDWQSPEIEKLFDGFKEEKMEQFYKRVELLQKSGYEITPEEVLEVSDNEYPIATTIAEVLLSKAENRTKESLQPYISGDKSRQAYFNFYRDFLSPGAKAYVPSKNPEITRVINLILELGGVPVLAHPGSSLNPKEVDIIDDLKEAGLKGLEVYSNYHSAEETKKFKAIAEDKGLLITAGSDYHGELKPEIELGQVDGNSYSIVKELKKLSK